MRSTTLILFIAVLAKASALRGRLNQQRKLPKEGGDKKKGGKKNKEKQESEKNEEKQESDSPKLNPFELFNPFDGLDGINSLKDLRPELVGYVHNSIFNKLGEIYEELDVLDPIRVMMDISQSMATVCDKLDDFCRAMAYEATINAFQRIQGRECEIEIPERMDPKIVAHLELADAIIQSANPDNEQEVLEMLETIQADMSTLQGVNPNFQSVGVGSLSVAIASFKLWTNVMKDESHPLYRLVFPEEVEPRQDDIDSEVDAGITIDISINYDNIIDDIQTTVSQTVGAAVNTVVTTVQTAANIGGNVIQAGVGVVDTSVNTISTTVEGTVDLATNIVGTGTDIVGNVVGTTVNIGQEIVGTTINTTTAVIDGTTDVIGNVVGAVTENTVEAVVTVADRIKERTARIFKRAQQIVRCDTNGAANGAAAMVEQAIENPVLFSPWNLLPMATVAVFWYSAPSSAAAAFADSFEP